MKDEIKGIKFIEYNGIEGYIELMKHDVEPLNNPECKSIELYYDGKDIKAVLDYITNLQERNEKAIEYINTHQLFKYIYDEEELFEIITDKEAKKDLENILNGGDNNE